MCSPIAELGLVTEKSTTFEVPPPGLGFTTVTKAVPALATSEARILAFSREGLTKVVARALPFHFTTDAETNPVPLTVRLNPAPPGVMASGTRGSLMRGTGFVVPVSAPGAPSACCSGAARPTGLARAANKVMTLIKTGILGLMLPPFCSCWGPKAGLRDPLFLASTPFPLGGWEGLKFPHLTALSDGFQARRAEGSSAIFTVS